jgi:hypothetical protein
MVKNEITIRYYNDHKIIQTSFDKIDPKIYDNIEYLEINILESQTMPLPFPNKLNYLVIDLTTYNYKVLNINNLPETIEKLTLSNIDKLTIDKYPSKLKSLVIKYCGFVVKPPLPETIKTLQLFQDVAWFDELGTLPEGLEVLTVMSKHLHDFKDKNGLTIKLPLNIKHMILGGQNIMFLPDISYLIKLKYLQLDLQNLYVLGELPDNLETLQIISNRLKEFRCELPENLAVLKIYSKGEVDYIPPLPETIKVCTINCPSVKEVESYNHTIKIEGITVKPKIPNLFNRKHRPVYEINL